MRLVRINAASWKISRNDIGIMGFSAGGHLAATIATRSLGEAKPNFQILFYPVISMLEGYGHDRSRTNFLGQHPGKRDEKKYSADMNVSRVTPRAFIALSDDDDTVPPANGVNYYSELYRNDVRASLHVYPGGGHGLLGLDEVLIQVQQDRLPLSRRDDDGPEGMAQELLRAGRPCLTQSMVLGRSLPTSSRCCRPSA